MSIRKYGRYRALYDDAGEMVCVCLYRKGAAEAVSQHTPLSLAIGQVSVWPRACTISAKVLTPLTTTASSLSCCAKR